MDGHNQHHQPYGMPDFRHLMAGVPQPPELFPTHHRGPQPMDLMMAAAAASHPMKIHGRGDAAGASLHEFQTESSPAVTVPYDGGDGCSARWPRQETLTLLEIRSRLDARFREANQKGPLWDEVSRIMSEEHGYQRTGKKCREKFENLYKYYKKTKEGKAGRQDGKHYRFFRQLEALYGDNSSSNAPTAVYNSIPESQGLINSFGSYHPGIVSPHQLMKASISNNKETTPSQKISDSLSLSGSSDFDTSDSSDGNNNSTGLTDHLMVKKRRSGRSWKAKIKEFIDLRMRKMIEKQEAWAEKMMRAMEEKEQERLVREEEWRRQEIARIDKEHKFWAKERAWIEARDAAIMEALRNLMSRSSSSDDMMSINNHLITACLDSHEKGAVTETAKLGDVPTEGNFLKKGKDYYEKKRKEEFSRSDGNNYYPGDDDSLYNRGGVAAYNCGMINEQGSEAAPGVRHHPLNVSSSPSNSNAGIPVQDSCFRFLMGGDGGSLWENYGVKINKGEN